MKVVSLFDGISCLMEALERANLPVSKYYASEIDKFAKRISAYNHTNVIQVGDVQKFGKETPYPDDLLSGVDLLVFGSPCTDLSSAKKNGKGLKGEQSKLFFEAVRILNDLKPKYFIMENVFSMKKGDKEIISEHLGVEPINDRCGTFISTTT